jgi:hypothetical protein
MSSMRLWGPATPGKGGGDEMHGEADSWPTEARLTNEGKVSTVPTSTSAQR